MKKENWKGWNWSYNHGMPAVFIDIQRVIVLGLFGALIYLAAVQVYIPLAKWAWNALVS